MGRAGPKVSANGVVEFKSGSTEVRKSNVAYGPAEGFVFLSLTVTAAEMDDNKNEY